MGGLRDSMSTALVSFSIDDGDSMHKLNVSCEIVGFCVHLNFFNMCSVCVAWRARGVVYRLFFFFMCSMKS